MDTLKDLRERHRISQVDLSEAAGMSVHGVLRYEQMLYRSPSVKYLFALSEMTGVPVSELEEIYRRCRARQINRAADMFSPFLCREDWMENTMSAIEMLEKHFPHIAAPDLISHPFKAFRIRLASAINQPTSQVHFCIMTCTHPSYLDNFEKGKTGRIPRHLSEILTAAGMDTKYLNRLNAASRKYKEWVRSND